MISQINKKITISATDFGLTHGITDGIIEVIENGVVRSVSAVVGGTSGKRAVDYLRNNCIDAGIHLTLNNTKPMLPIETVSTLIDQDTGRFYNSAASFSKLFKRGVISPDEIEKEFHKQIEVMVLNDIKISHIDTHQNIIRYSAIYEIILKLSQIFNIKKLKIRPPQTFREKLKKIFSGKPEDTENNIEIIYYTSLYQIPFSKLVKSFKERKNIDILVHPGVDDAESDRIYPYIKYEREKELKLLKSWEFKKFLIDNNYY
ncbi:MAG: ChbG/HpnK family deacetylase [Actinomycetia bacterium]|nr:ChbG/HpnK family deacetylase [Actinomycetes bacterium]